MPVLQGPTTVAGNSISTWVSTDGETNIAVGVQNSKDARIEYNFGSAQIYGVDPSNMTRDGAIVAKANEIRVRNTGTLEISFEVFV